MLFNSLQFMLFFPIVILVAFAIPNRFKYIWLLICNYIFYLSQDNAVALFLVIATVISWLSGKWLYRITESKKRQILTIALAILNLTPLIILKYSNFFLNIAGSDKRLDMILPAGISFFAFQSTTYIIDCYRKESKPENNLFKYALFVSFFPTILSGPIERSKSFLPQIDIYDNKGFDPDRVKRGLMNMLWGYFLKFVIADRLFILTDNVFSSYKDHNGAIILIGVLAFTIRIYCDFAGYSYVAIGCARILGYDIMDNFRQPYLSRSIAEFWGRWHISLSSWFRDYLYIPLGGNRKGKVRKCINLMLVFIVSGLWHGADLSFLLWGLLHGFYQVIASVSKDLKKGLTKEGGVRKVLDKGPVKKLWQLLSYVFTFLLVAFTWIPFLAGNIKDSGGIFLGIFKNFSPLSLIDGSVFKLGLGVKNLLIVVFAVFILFITDLCCERKKCRIDRLLDNTRPLIRWVFYYTLILLILFSLNLSTTEFLYQSF